MSEISNICSYILAYPVLLLSIHLLKKKNYVQAIMQIYPVFTKKCLPYLCLKWQLL